MVLLLDVTCKSFDVIVVSENILLKLDTKIKGQGHIFKMLAFGG